MARFASNSKWRAVEFSTSVTLSEALGTETYRVSLRHATGDDYYFYFIPEGGPTFATQRLPLKFSASTGFAGHGEAVEYAGGRELRVPVAVTISFDNHGSHVWAITYGPGPAYPRPLTFSIRFSR